LPWPLRRRNEEVVDQHQTSARAKNLGHFGESRLHPPSKHKRFYTEGKVNRTKVGQVVKISLVKCVAAGRNIGPVQRLLSQADLRPAERNAAGANRALVAAK
jgi:hypothetical protein